MTRRSQLTILLLIAPVLAAAWIWAYIRLTRPEENSDLKDAEELMMKYERLKRQGKLREADEVRDKVLAIGEQFFRSGERAKASQVFGMVLGRDENNPTAKHYANLLRVTHEADTLIREYDEQVKQGDEAAAAETMDDLLVEGRRLYDARDFEGARSVFAGILDRRPDQPLALNFLGVMAKDDGDLMKAIEYYRRAVEADPNTPANYYNLAGIYFQEKSYLAAEEQLLKAMRLGPKSSYFLLYALCGRERDIDGKELVDRLHKTIEVAALQVFELQPSDMRAVANDWTQATKLLKDRGDDFGVTRLRQLAGEAKKPEVKQFADDLLKTLE